MGVGKLWGAVQPCHSNNSLITQRFLFETHISDWPGLLCYCFSNSVVCARAARPSSSSTSGRHSRQPTEAASVGRKKLSSISRSEKRCGFADDLLSRRIQCNCSSRGRRSPKTFAIQRAHSCETMSHSSLPSYIQALWIAGKLLIRKVMHAWRFRFTRNFRSVLLVWQQNGQVQKKDKTQDVYVKSVQL